MGFIFFIIQYMAHTFTATTTAATITKKQLIDKRFTMVQIQNRGTVGLFVGFEETATTDKIYIDAGATQVFPNQDMEYISILAESATVKVVTQTF